MNHDEHLDAARQVLGSLAKLDPQTDRFALIDGAMVAAYHLGNAALHAHDVTKPAVHYNTPSKFEVPPDSLPPAVQSIYLVFAELEKLRSRYVRSPEEPDSNAAHSAQQLLARMAQLCGDSG